MMMNTNHDTHAMMLAEHDFNILDMDDTAYVREVHEDGQTLWSIHSADGQQIGMAPSRDLAFAAIIQHELEPASVH